MTTLTAVTPVLAYLARRVEMESHTFGSDKGYTNHGLFREKVERDVVLVCIDNNVVTIPAGSDMVVYRHPTKTEDHRLKVACFHYPDSRTQTVVYAGGIAQTTRPGEKSVYDGGLLIRRGATLQTPD